MVFRMVLSKKQNGASGEVPEFGAIFMSNRSSKKVCFRKKLFGLPASFASFVNQIKAGMLLFLFEYEKRELYGVYQASSDGAINHSYNVLSSSVRTFSAQVQFKVIWYCQPLRENEFRDAIKDNYFAAYKFNFGLSKDQVRSLLWLFSSRKLRDELPPKHILRDDPARHSVGHNVLNRAIGDDRYDITDTTGEISLENSNILMTEYPETSARTVERVVGNTSFMEDTVKKFSNNGQATLGNGLHNERLFMDDIEHHGHNYCHQDEPIMPSGYSKDSFLRITTDGRFLASDGTDYVHNLDDGGVTFIPDECHFGEVPRSFYDGWSITSAGVNDGKFDADNVLRTKSERAYHNVVTDPNHVVPHTYPELSCTNVSQSTHPANTVTEVDNSVVHGKPWKSSMARDEFHRSSVVRGQGQISSVPPCSFELAISNFPCEISHDDTNDVGTAYHKLDATMLVHHCATGGHDHQNLHQSSHNNLPFDCSILSKKLLVSSHPKPVMEGYPDADSGLRCNDSSQSLPNCISHARNSTIPSGYPRGWGSETVQVEDYEGMSFVKSPLASKPSVKERNHTGFAVGAPACDMGSFRGSSPSCSMYPVAQLDKSIHVVPTTKGAADADILFSSEVDRMHRGFLSESHREEYPEVYSSVQDYKSHERVELCFKKKGTVFSRLNSATDKNNGDAGTSHDKNSIDMMVDEVMEILHDQYKQAKRERKFSSFRSQDENLSRIEKHQHSQTRNSGQPTIPMGRKSADECVSQLNKGAQVINFKRRSEARKIREETKADASRGSSQDVSIDVEKHQYSKTRTDAGQPTIPVERNSANDCVIQLNKGVQIINFKHQSEARKIREETKADASRGSSQDVSIDVEKHQHSQTRMDSGQPTIPVERNSADECVSQLNKGVQVINFKRRSEVRKIREEIMVDVPSGSSHDVPMDEQFKRRKLVRPDFSDCNLNGNDDGGEGLTMFPSDFEPV